MKKTMKNLMMLILALVMILSLCACAGDDTHNRNDDDDDEDIPAAVVTPEDNNTDSLVPTAEEQAVLDQYRQIVYTLSTSQNQEELDDCYHQLLEIDTAIIEKWAGTEFAPAKQLGFEICWDYNTVMDAITILENVMLSQKETRTDFIGEVKDGSAVTSWLYNENGQISYVFHEIWAFEVFETNPAEFSGNRSYTYDENGRVSQIRYTGGAENYLVELTYDENGNKILEHATSAYGESFDIVYTYNERNQLTKIECGTSTPVTCIYTYDDNGFMIREQHITHYGSSFVETTDYTYDENGHAVSAVMTLERWWGDLFESSSYVESRRVDQYTFTCDEDGNIVQVHIIPGDEYFVADYAAGQIRNEAIDAAQDIYITYGNYYIFNLD